MTVVLFILKALVFFIIELMLSKFTAEQMKIKFPLGAQWSSSRSAGC